MKKLVKHLILFLSLGVIPFQAYAKTVLGIVSPRNSADLLAGAHGFLKVNRSHQVILRTTDQWIDLSDTQQGQLLSQADIVFSAGVFGEAATILLKQLSDKKIASFMAVHSDRRLVERSHLQGRRLLKKEDLAGLMADPQVGDSAALNSWVSEQLAKFPQHKAWLLSRIYWSNREEKNVDNLIRHLLSLVGESITVSEPRLKPSLRILIGDREQSISTFSDDVFMAHAHWVVLLDYENGNRPGDRELHRDLCRQLNDSDVGCLRVLAKWGEASVEAIKLLRDYRKHLSAMVSIQNFVVGAGEGREQVNQLLIDLNLPIIKAIRLTDMTEDQWRLSEEGLRWDSVHYRVAMPELQAIGQPQVVSAMSKPSLDASTGLKVSLSQPIDEQIELLDRRLLSWLELQSKTNADKKLGIVYYNHPPGRHNIGADNLNVPSSLFHLLQRLQREGYDTGELPESEQVLLDLLQERGVNLPENNRALREMSQKINRVSIEQYRQWFERLPSGLKQEMRNGPLGYLQNQLKHAMSTENRELGSQLVHRVIEDLRHVVEGAEHQARDRVLKLLQQLQESYQQALLSEQPQDWQQAYQFVDAIANSGIEGMGGWGDIPGNVMVHDEQLLLPGIVFGNVFVGPQPPRGWELNEELLHANLSFPPPHQYMAFYQWLRNDFKVDALIHLGRHSTYEFLPRHRVGLGSEDYSLALLDDVPSIYPYIVDGVGEGIQAKRRGLAVMVDHLTPPLESTELYDELLQLRQLVESYEAAPEAAGAMRRRAIDGIKVKVEELNLRDELVASMATELEARGYTQFEQVDDELLVHEVGHYLTKLQEDFMPLGLHKFGMDWSEKSIDTMVKSMQQGVDITEGEEKETLKRWRQQLAVSPSEEMSALLKGLNGGYVAPGKGNDPIRTPEVLPTGKNFFALDGSLIPSRLGYDVGVELARQARQSNNSPESDAIVLWASDVVRDEGAMIAFGLDMLGLQPVWSSRGIVKRLERLDIASMTENGQPRLRRDTVYTTSGLFRDLYGRHLVLLEKAVLMALDGSSDLIREKYPALTYTLDQTLAPLAKEQQPGRESLEINLVAARWVDDARKALQQGVSASEAGPQAAYRVFGDAPGTYGAGVNRMVERSGSWTDRAEIAQVYLRRMGHAYGAKLQGDPVQDVFEQRLKNVEQTYMGRSSNLYGLIDNNDAFDYLGGLSLAVETVKGKAPENFILFHPDASNISMEPLEVALLSELRGRFLNPQWLQPLMQEGYAGARTMGSEFMEYLWGWQVTNPEVIKSWVWDEVKSVYVDDAHDLGLDDFLQDGHNAHVKTNMLAILLVAADKEFWQASEEDLQQVSELFTQLVLENGLPGSGHTSPDHPIFDFVETYVDDSQYQELKALLQDSQITKSSVNSPSVIAELSMIEPSKASEKSESLSSESSLSKAGENKVNEDPAEKSPVEQSEDDENSEKNIQDPNFIWMGLLILVLLIVGWIRGARVPART
ncbi:MAG: cobaltochelatase subunit CobN [Cellvibrionaceae bacterium]